jgi:hypothetical protein
MAKRHISTALAVNMRSYRNINGWSLQTMAALLQEQVQLDPPYRWQALREWEVGSCEPPLAITAHIADLFNISINKLIGWPEPAGTEGNKV